MFDFLSTAPIGGTSSQWAIWLISLAGTAFLTFTAWGQWVRKNKDDFKEIVTRAYNIVESIAATTPNPIDDKMALALKHVSDFLAADGKTATAESLAKAKLMLEAMHGDVKVQQKVAAAAVQGVPGATLEAIAQPADLSGVFNDAGVEAALVRVLGAKPELVIDPKVTDWIKAVATDQVSRALEGFDPNAGVDSQKIVMAVCTQLDTMGLSSDTVAATAETVARRVMAETFAKALAGPTVAPAAAAAPATPALAVAAMKAAKAGDAGSKS